MGMVLQRTSQKERSGSDEPACALQLALSVSEPRPEELGSRGRLSSAAALRTLTEEKLQLGVLQLPGLSG